MSKLRLFSLEQRLQVGLLTILVIVFVALWGAATYTIHQLVEHYLVTRLDHDADMLARHLHRQQQRWQVDWEAINPIYLKPHTGHYFVIETPRQRIASPSLAGYPLHTPRQPAANPYETLAPAMASDTDLEPVLVWHRRYQVDDVPVHIYVAENHMPIQRYLYRFDVLFALIALGVLVLVGWWSRRMLHQGFVSLTQLQQAVHQAIETQAPIKLPERLPQEVAPLAETLQQALSQLQARLQRYRHANADLAHSLKTPLHAIFQLLDDPAIALCPEAREALKQQAQRLRDRIEHVLRQARVAGGALAVARFDLEQALPQLVETLRTLYPEKTLSVQAPAHGVLPIEREDGFELLGNLLDNACKWAHRQACMTIERRADGWLIRIEDDGPGVPEAHMARLGQRGARLDEQSSENGIGLAMVREVIQQYEGTLRFGRSALGGLQVDIFLKE